MDRSSYLSRLDIFPKIESCFTRSSPAGGTVSLFTYILIAIVLLSELLYYLDSDVTYMYSVDKVFDKKLKINIDLTVATPCQFIGADVMDSTNKHSMYSYGHLKETGINYQLSEQQQKQWDELKFLSQFIRDEHHNIHRMIWKPYTPLSTTPTDEIDHQTEFMPMFVIHNHNNNTQFDSCKLHGTLIVNKVSGNFHIAAGKYLPLPIGHAHISLVENEKVVNFSHRIERFSFGDEFIPKLVNTLDGVEKTTQSNNQIYQYYLKVVLTNVQTSSYNGEMYQYSVTERDLNIDHESESTSVHGVPGIYFKYDIEGIKIDVIEQRNPLWKFLVRLCAIIGGIVEMSILLNQFVSYMIDDINSKSIKSSIAKPI